MNMAEEKRRHSEFVEALEEERRKIQMFSRELPLCLKLVNEAIVSLRREMAVEEASSEKLVFEDFMGIKPKSSLSRSDRERTEGFSDCKKDWLRSVNLRGPVASEEPDAERGTLRKPVAVNARRVCGAFQPFERNKPAPSVAGIPVPFAAPAISSTTTASMVGRPDGGGVVEEEERQSLATAQPNRKQRRCWSPDLHRKFLNALDELGGSHVATPKQIREMMKVDSLTNDEVKSHLQKYRLHTRRPVATVQSSSSNGTQDTPHFVLLGSIWVPPNEYAAVATQRREGSSAVLNDAFSPAASQPIELGLHEEQSTKKEQINRSSVKPMHSQQMLIQDDDSLLDDAATNSNSSSASFFSQTTTVSPPL